MLSHALSSVIDDLEQSEINLHSWRRVVNVPFTLHEDCEEETQEPALELICQICMARDGTWPTHRDPIN